MQHRQHLRRQVDDILALFHGDLFADGFAADRQSGNERRDHGGYDDAAPAEAVLQQHDDDRRGRAADDAADVTDHIVAERGDLFRVADEVQRLLRALDTVRGHRIERLGIRRRHGDADDIEQDAQRNEQQQDQRCSHIARILKHRARAQAHRGGKRHSDQRHTDDPARVAGRLFRFLLLSVFFVFQGFLLHS